MKIVKQYYSGVSDYIASVIAFVVLLPLSLFIDAVFLILNMLLFALSFGGILSKPDYLGFMTFSKDFPIPIYKARTRPRFSDSNPVSQKSVNKLGNIANNKKVVTQKTHNATSLEEELDKLRNSNNK